MAGDTDTVRVRGSVGRPGGSDDFQTLQYRRDIVRMTDAIARQLGQQSQHELIELVRHAVDHTRWRRRRRPQVLAHHVGIECR